jgi:hypothetical protein
VERLLDAMGPPKAGVFLAVADDSAVSTVLRGENADRALHHVAVVRNLRQGVGSGHAARPRPALRCGFSCVPC